MSESFSYVVRGRLLWSWPILISGLTMLVLAGFHGAADWVWLLLFPCITISIVQIAFRPLYGVDYARDELTIYQGHRKITLPIAQIAYLRLASGTPAVVLEGGLSIALPIVTERKLLPFIRESTARGIPVRQIETL